ncbi:MAG: hypothetical protein KTR16_03885 [Acidiferrobacterales bacterium]|nr:hypothetical protein [Acidiferrobacterales bacterium]
MNQINYQLLQQVHRLRPIVRAQVHGASCYLPQQIVSSIELMSEIKTDLHYGMPTNWMDKEMGILHRRMVDLEEKPSDLAIKAAEKLLGQHEDLDKDRIDAVIFCGIERDRPEPATAHTVQYALGLNAAHVFDVANACFGFYDGLKLASSLIESSLVDHALVVTGEVTTKMARNVVEQLKRGMPLEKAKHLWGMLSVGDAGGAMLLGPSENQESGFVKFHQTSKSQYVNLCHYQWKPNGDVEAHMNMANIVARGLKMNKQMYKEALDELGWNKVDWAVAHQTGRTAFEHAINLHGIQASKLVKTYPYLGNITTATLPVSFQKLIDSGNLQWGDRIGGLFAGSGLVAGQFGYIY